MAYARLNSTEWIATRRCLANRQYGVDALAKDPESTHEASIRAPTQTVAPRTGARFAAPASHLAEAHTGLQVLTR